MGPTTNAHPGHTPTGATTECDNCHGNATYSVSTGYLTGGPTGLHNNGTADIYLVRANAGNNDNGTYAGSGGSCSLVDCHNNSNSPRWDGQIIRSPMCPGRMPRHTANG